MHIFLKSQILLLLFSISIKYFNIENSTSGINETVTVCHITLRLSGSASSSDSASIQSMYYAAAICIPNSAYKYEIFHDAMCFIHCNIIYHLKHIIHKLIEWS